MIPWEWDRAMRLLQFSLTATGTAEESDRHMPRPITPYRGVINESRWGEVRSFSPLQGACRHLGIYLTLFLIKRVYLNRNLARDIVVLKPA